MKYFFIMCHISDCVLWPSQRFVSNLISYLILSIWRNLCMDSIFSTNASRCKVSKVRIEFYQKEDLNGNRFQDSEKNQLIFIVTISTFSLLSAIHFFKDVEVTSAIKVSAYNSALITPPKFGRQIYDCKYQRRGTSYLPNIVSQMPNDVLNWKKYKN